MQGNAHRDFLIQFSKALLKFHKTLIDTEKIKYEKVNGRVNSSGEFLRLLMEHPDFQWLRSISQLVAQIDQHVDDTEHLADKDVQFFKHAFEQIELQNDFLKKLNGLAGINSDVLVASFQLQTMLKKVH